ncbi:MAG: entericidin A/B family lipoprotein [Kiloniellaceae bacterium]
MTPVSNGTESNTRKLLLGIALAGLSVVALSACNTMEGAGKDVESAGEAIQDGADND